MKHIKSIFYYVLVACVAFAFQACSSDDDSDSVNISAEGVYFPNTNSESIEITKEGTSFDVPIMRASTGSSQTVLLTAIGTDSLYNVPSSVTFKKGESTANITITYDGDNIGYDNYSEITIAISGANLRTSLGNSSYSFTVGIPSTWTSLGECTFSDDFLTTFYSIGITTYSVELQENDMFPGYYRLVNPYGEAFPWNVPGDWDDSQDWYLEIHAEDPDAVYIEVQETGLDWGYGMMSVGSIAGYYISDGYSLEEVKAAGYTGTLVDGVITFPVNTLLFSEADYENGALYYANLNSGFKVVLPGYSYTDYCVSLAYAGTYTNSSGGDEGVLAVVSSIGADAESIRLAVVAGEDYATAVESVKSGSVSYTEAAAETGVVEVPFNGDPTEGIYTVVAVTYDSNGEAHNYAFVQFMYSTSSSGSSSGTSSNETWTATSTGDYTYSQFFSGTDEGLTLYQGETDATRYKIGNWGSGVDFCFTYNSETGEVLVDNQETGYVDSSYGTVYVSDLVEYTGSTSFGQSYYENGTFYFAVVYYSTAGEYGYGYETFTLTGDSNEATVSTATRAGTGQKTCKATTPKRSSLVKKQIEPKSRTTLRLFK